MAPRWKGKAAEAKDLAEPMSGIVSQLQSSLTESNSQGLLSGCSVLLAAHPEQIELLNQACFGCPVFTAENDKQWFQLSLEGLYLCSVMKFIKVIGENKCVKNDDELWRYMTSKKVGFPYLFKAYSHLRMKNWVVRAGSQYGADFVAYRHHPALVHSEYAVLVLSGDDESKNARLKAWSDFHCTLRLCGNVAKTLLVLHISKKSSDGALSTSSLEDYCVEERIVTRWNPGKSRENQTMVEKESCVFTRKYKISLCHDVTPRSSVHLQPCVRQAQKFKLPRIPKTRKSYHGNQPIMASKPIMASIWKAKAAEAKALAKPMSALVSRLQSSLTDSNSQGLLSGCSMLFAANPEQTELLNQTCFGRPVITAEKDKQWFQLSLEEALYLCSVMKCIKAVGENKCVKSDEELWRYMTSKKCNFLFLFKAYSHLRMKNWVVRSGSQYGVDFVAYRHHPALVHSEYAVLVLSGDDESKNARLKAWSDFHCTLRLCGGVSKTLLVLHISKKSSDCALSTSSLEDYCVEERIITRWNPEQSCENRTMVEKESCKSRSLFSILFATNYIDFVMSMNMGIITKALQKVWFQWR